MSVVKRRKRTDRTMAIKRIILNHRRWVAGEIEAYELAKKIVKLIETTPTNKEEN